MIVDGGGTRGRHRRPKGAAASRDRGERLRLGPREARGAAGEAVRRRRGHQGRRGHRDGPQEAQGSRRGRCLGREGRGRRGHHHRRRRSAGAGPVRRSSRCSDSLSGDEALGVDVFSHGAVRAAVLDRDQRRDSMARSWSTRSASCRPDRASTPRRWTYGDLLADGVVDPVKVTRSAVLNAASVARMILTTETAIVDKPEEPVEVGHGHGHGHGHSH